MLTRYDLVVDINCPEDACILYPTEEGEYIKHSEAMEKINFAISVLHSLKECDVSKNHYEELNRVVTNAIEQLRR